MSGMLESFCSKVDALNDWTAKIVRWLILPLTLLVTGEVVLRYVFNSPTIWSLDITVQTFAAFVILGGGYTLLSNGHISVDVLSTRLSLRGRAIVDLVTSVFFFGGIGMFLWKAAGAAWKSILVREAMFSYFRPPLYPLRVVIVLGILLLLLQGIVKFIRDLQTATHSGQVERL